MSELLSSQLNNSVLVLGSVRCLLRMRMRMKRSFRMFSLRSLSLDPKGIARMIELLLLPNQQNFTSTIPTQLINSPLHIDLTRSLPSSQRCSGGMFTHGSLCIFQWIPMDMLRLTQSSGSALQKSAVQASRSAFRPAGKTSTPLII